MWPWHMYGWGWGGALIGIASMLLFLGILIALVIVRSQSRSGRHTGWSDNFGARDRTALDILKERYARGEISRQEYQDMRREIETP